MEPVTYFHSHVKVITRGKGKSAVASAAYQARQSIKNEYDGITHDYTYKRGVVHSEILLPEHAPRDYSNRSVLWNAVEKIEKASNAQTKDELYRDLIEACIDNGNILLSTTHSLQTLTRILLFCSNLENPTQTLIAFDNIEYLLTKENEIYNNDFASIFEAIFEFVKNEESLYEKIGLNFAKHFKIVIAIRNTVEQMISASNYNSSVLKNSIDVSNWFNINELLKKRISYFDYANNTFTIPLEARNDNENADNNEPNALLSEMRLRNIHSMYLNISKAYTSHNSEIAVVFKGKKQAEIIYDLRDTVFSEASQSGTINIESAIKFHKNDKEEFMFAIFFNHPNGTSFSFIDIAMLIKHDNIQELFLDSGKFIYFICKNSNYKVYSEVEKDNIIQKLNAIYQTVSVKNRDLLDGVIGSKIEEDYNNVTDLINNEIWETFNKEIGLIISYGKINKAYLLEEKDGDSLQSVSNIEYEKYCSSFGKVAYSQDERRVLTVSGDVSISEWNRETGEFLCAYEGHSSYIRCVAYSNDGQFILTASDDCTIREWNRTTGVCRIYKGHTSYLRSAVYSNDGQRILSASKDKTIKEWDRETGKLLKTITGHTSSVRSAVYSADGRRILSASGDETVREWDRETGECLRIFKGHTSYVYSAVYSIDGQRVLSSSGDTTIREWDRETAACLRVFSGHTSSVNHAVYSSDGLRFLSASRDKSIREWNIVTGECLCVYSGHNSIVISVAYSIDSQRFLAISKDKTACEWEIGTGICLRIFGGRSLTADEISFDELIDSFHQAVRKGDYKTAYEILPDLKATDEERHNKLEEDFRFLFFSSKPNEALKKNKIDGTEIKSI